MKKASVENDTGVCRGDPFPSCHWSFNSAHKFHHIAGDAASIFHRPAADLWRRHVSIIDDPSGTWAARLNRMFQGQAPMEQSTAPGPDGEYVLFHVPVRGDDDTVIFVAGFAFPAGPLLPGAAAELQLAARATVQAVEVKRTRTTRLLHDVVAQSLSGAGLQLELLKLEIQAQSADALQRTAEIQKSLEEVLKLIREFNAPE
jgi:signal transduction histidine kinase